MIGSSSTRPSRNSSLTILVSTLKPAPSWETSLATIRSRFLAVSLAAALATRSWVSAANPTSNRLPLAAPSSARMSGFFSSSMAREAAVFFTFVSERSLGR